MAEPQTSNAIVPVDGEYMLDIREFDAAGKTSVFKVPVPRDFTAQNASIMLRSAILKKTTWKAQEFATIMSATMYADNYGLDIMAGDVYMTPEGRFSTTAGAKIRHAMGTNRIAGYKIEITDGPTIKIPYRLKEKDHVYEGPNLIAKVTVKVKGWEEPVIYEARLSEWFVGHNPNWRTRPGYMLRKNALSKALEEIAPLGIEADEAPPLDNK